MGLDATLVQGTLYAPSEWMLVASSGGVYELQ